ncbi:MAG: helix-turn-helix transcriptional regulator [Balneolaceae bacterium]
MSFDIRCAIEYFNEHLFYTQCRVDTMRKICRIRQNNFSLRFKHHTGFTPAGYLTHHRIEAAKLLLSEVKLKKISISEIGFTVGYERASTFTTIFKNKEGITPGEWRNNN